MIEGSGSGSTAGSGSGSIALTSGSGSGSGRPKNRWIRIRIRIRNTVRISTVLTLFQDNLRTRCRFINQKAGKLYVTNRNLNTVYVIDSRYVPGFCLPGVCSVCRPYCVFPGSFLSCPVVNSPQMGDKFDSGIRLSYRPASLWRSDTTTL